MGSEYIVRQTTIWATQYDEQFKELETAKQIASMRALNRITQYITLIEVRPDGEHIIIARF